MSKMLIQFATSEEVFKSFIDAIELGVAAVAIMGVAVFLELVEKQKFLAIKVAGCVICIGVTFVLLATYFSNYGNFISAEFNSAGAKLVYPGYLGKEVFVPSSDIKNILFGLPGKIADRCYIRIEQASGKDHRSATMIRKVDDCKGLRVEILAVLKP